MVKIGESIRIKEDRNPDFSISFLTCSLNRWVCRLCWCWGDSSSRWVGQHRWVRCDRCDRRRGGHGGGRDHSGSWRMLRQHRRFSLKGFLRQKRTLQLPWEWKHDDHQPPHVSSGVFMKNLCCLPGLEAAGDGLSLASKLCSLCLNTSLGLKDLWEISCLASWEWRREFREFKELKSSKSHQTGATEACFTTL